MTLPVDNVVERASRFAERAHASIEQKRKYTKEPYIVHPAAVAEVVATVTDDTAMIAAAWLHDVVEDTPVTLEEIEEKFGTDIAGLVENLTNVSQLSDGNREVRKAIDRQHTAQADPRAKTVKLADLLDNLPSIATHDRGFARVYLKEKERVLDVLEDGDPVLLRRARELVAGLKSDLAE